MPARGRALRIGSVSALTGAAVAVMLMLGKGARLSHIFGRFIGEVIFIALLFGVIGGIAGYIWIRRSSGVPQVSPIPGGLSCAKCGRSLPTSAKFCEGCGAPLT